MPRRARLEAGAGRPAAPPLGLSVFFGLIRLVNLAARPFAERVGRPERLTLPEWRVMVVLASGPGATGAEIALESGLDKMAVSRAVAALERAGRARRSRDKADRRMERIALTPSGLAVYHRIENVARRRESILLGGLSSAERSELARMVEVMTSALIAADDEPRKTPRSGRRPAGPSG